MHSSDCWLSDCIVLVGQLCGVDIQPHRVHCSLWVNGEYDGIRTSMTWAGAEWDTSYDPRSDDTVTGLYRIAMTNTDILRHELAGAVSVIERMGVRSTSFTFMRALFGVTTTNVCCTFVASLLGVKLDEPTPNNLMLNIAYGVEDAWEL